MNFSVGFDHVDLAAANARDIVVTNTPEVLSDATAELTIMLILEAECRGREAESSTGDKERRGGGESRKRRIWRRDTA